jgi:hypothetical protein
MMLLLHWGKSKSGAASAAQQPGAESQCRNKVKATGQQNIETESRQLEPQHQHSSKEKNNSDS